jgi:hypothetical protein
LHAATFVQYLLSSAQGVMILATTRERLRAAGEWVHQPSPLGAPPESSTPSAQEARGYPAVEMFEDRAAFALGGLPHQRNLLSRCLLLGRILWHLDAPRPQPGDGAPNEKITDWQIKINALIERLTADVPADPVERDEERQARWTLANIVDWHRREEKAVWWEYFRLAALSAEDLLEERAGLSGLEFAGAAGGTAKAPIHRYRFPPQESEIRGGEELCNLGGAKLGMVVSISLAD